MPCDYSKYPPDWFTRIRPAILKRARNRCEFCGVLNGEYGMRDKDGNWMGDEPGEGEMIRIVLTIAHLNHDITDNRPENLAALCQRCHLNHDRKQHLANRWKNKYKNQPDLFPAEEVVK